MSLTLVFDISPPKKLLGPPDLTSTQICHAGYCSDGSFHGFSYYNTRGHLTAPMFSLVYQWLCPCLLLMVTIKIFQHYTEVKAKTVHMLYTADLEPLTVRNAAAQPNAKHDPKSQSTQRDA